MDIAHVITHIATLGLPAGALSMLARHGGKAALVALSPAAQRERSVKVAMKALLEAEDDAERARAEEALRLLASTGTPAG